MPTWSELRRYLKKEVWLATLKIGNPSRHVHQGSSKRDVLQCRVSHGTGETPPYVWKRILSHQLQITVEEFNRNK